MKHKLIDIVHDHPYLTRLFDVCDSHLSNYYIGAGVITQTVWNHLHGYHLTYGIGDADIIYYNLEEDKDRIKEKQIESIIKDELATFPFDIDVTNEALVHYWYEEKFQKRISPYSTCEEAIDSWPTTASAVGVRRTENGYDVYAPFGLGDLFQMVIRPNKALVTEEVYYNKARKWKAKWPEIQVIPW
jgi:hypothetical protein